MMRVLRVLWAYYHARQLVFGSRAALETYQDKKLRIFRKNLVASSLYFSRFTDTPIGEWPQMDKASMLANFDRMNTAGLKLQDVFDTALACENSRDFKPTLSGVSVGLSSGTSGQRGVFAISDKEAAKWAGIMLAKTLPDGLFAGERVALFLRANSNVYETVQSSWLTFRFFDLFDPFQKNIALLKDYQPTIIVAPAQVLRELALKVISGETQIRPKKTISVAEVLEPLDRELIEQVFHPVHQVYQATEGFLASTCERGTLHLNEEYLHIEPHWLDEEQRRFTPIITDFTRLTQPIVRYHLNDVLVASKTACSCGRVTRSLDAIEGRCDDMLVLPGTEQQSVTVFADVLSRVFARYLPRDADYRLIQPAMATLQLHASVDEFCLQQLKSHLHATLEQLGVDAGSLTWELHTHTPPLDAKTKRRRIIRHSV
jgi:putative adenylate-forming enzyme